MQLFHANRRFQNVRNKKFGTSSSNLFPPLLVGLQALGREQGRRWNALPERKGPHLRLWLDIGLLGLVFEHFCDQLPDEVPRHIGKQANSKWGSGRPGREAIHTYYREDHTLISPYLIGPCLFRAGKRGHIHKYLKAALALILQGIVVQPFAKSRSDCAKGMPWMRAHVRTANIGILSNVSNSFACRSEA